MAWKNKQDYLEHVQVCKIREVWGDTIFGEVAKKKIIKLQEQKINILTTVNRNL